MGTRRSSMARSCMVVAACVLTMSIAVDKGEATSSIAIEIKNRTSSTLVLNPAATSTNGADRDGKIGWLYSPLYLLGPNQVTVAKVKPPPGAAADFFLTFQIEYRDGADPANGDFLRVLRTNLYLVDKGLLAGTSEGPHSHDFEARKKLQYAITAQDQLTLKVKLLDAPKRLPHVAVRVPFYEPPDLSDLPENLGASREAWPDD